MTFACTTDFADRLDAAILRRFAFKIVLDYPSPGQAASGFRGYFGIDAPPEVARLATLTLGDFAVVRKKAEVLRCPDDPTALAGMPREECEAKEERRKPIGFRTVSVETSLSLKNFSTIRERIAGLPIGRNLPRRRVRS
ncbi:MAG: hypothetical protein OXO52_22235 [Rhodospirillales bacterium]|nr:hypothetical protein [Rhodospirillales bacterium]